MNASGTRRMSWTDQDITEFAAFLSDSEDWLMRRVLRYARELGYAEYTSTLEEAWRVSIVGLTEQLSKAIDIRGFDLELECSEDIGSDPAASFGIHEAGLHRSRGITLPMFLGLMKYYRQAYLDRVEESVTDKRRRALWTKAIERYFDRVEIGFVSEWASVHGSERSKELQRVNRALTNEKNRYLTVFESLQTPALLLGPDGLVENLNEAAMRVFGLSETSGSPYYSGVAVGMRFAPLAGTIADFVHSEKRELVTEQSIGTRLGERYFLVAMKRMLDVSGKFVGITLVLSDMTSLARAQNEAADNWKLYSHLFQNMPSAFANHLLVRDERGKAVDYVFLEVNSAFEDQIGIARESIIGKPVSAVLPGIQDDPFDWVGRYASVVDLGSAQRFDQYAAALKRWYDISAFPTGPDMFAAVFTDITDSKMYADQLAAMVERKTSQLREANRKLEEANRAKSSFLASMSHELRTPLNSIIGFSGMLGQGLVGELSDEQRHQVGLIHAAGEHLLKLVNQVLDLARIEAGRVEITPVEFDAREIVTQVTEMIAPLVRANDVRLDVKMPSRPVVVLTDMDCFAQIAINLLSNAQKFTRTGSITVELSAPRGRMVLRVEDTGPGIAEEDIPRLFEEFSRTGAPSGERVDGTGLGLAIAAGLAVRLGGEIHVASEPGVGSVFTVDLPRRIAETA